MEKISITRGLTTLKMLDKRIKKAIQSGCFTTYKVNKKTNEDCEAKKDFQSVTDLIDYRDRIKTSIAASNAATKVKIGKEKMTVVEAIEKKSSITYKIDLVRTMRQSLAYTRSAVEDINRDAERRLDKLIEASLGADNRNTTEVEGIAKPFMARNQAEVVDPLDIEKEVEKLEKEIEDFVTNVDVALSESNAKTEIEV